MNPQPSITRRCPFCAVPTGILYVHTHTSSLRTLHYVQCRFCNARGPTSSTSLNCSTLDTASAIAGAIFDWNHRSTTAEWGAGILEAATIKLKAIKLYDRRAAFIAKHCSPAKYAKKGKTKP